LDTVTEKICRAFGLDVQGKSSVGMLDFFHGFLLKQYELEQPTVLMIDDAHNLTAEAIEEINVISRLEAEEPNLIQMILLGRPELNYMIRRHHFAPLKNLGASLHPLLVPAFLVRSRSMLSQPAPCFLKLEV
jgi:type II secretory pathway predicted ATPase ExeA